MKQQLLLLLSLIGAVFYTSAQEFPAIGPNSNYVTCSGSFTDSGGLADNYDNGETNVTTICSPFPTDKIQVQFNSFDLASGEFLIVYDGDAAVGAPLGVFLGTNSPGTILATGTSGCLTFRFISDSSNVATGWDANIACIDNCQTITSIVATTPAADADGVIRLCQGDTLDMMGSANFSVDGAGATYEYLLPDGTLIAGQDITQTFNDSGIYKIDLIVTDTTGCRDRTLEDVIIYVSTDPDFTGTEALDTSICFGDTVDIVGMAETTEFFGEVAPPVTGQTFLPDDSGTTFYETCIDVSGFCSWSDYC
jgi:CUB domain.